MIDLLAPRFHSMIAPTTFLSEPSPAKAGFQRAAESLTAPNGSEEEIYFHRGLIAAAEGEFSRLLVQIESLLQPMS